MKLQYLLHSCFEVKQNIIFSVLKGLFFIQSCTSHQFQVRPQVGTLHHQEVFKLFAEMQTFNSFKTDKKHWYMSHAFPKSRLLRNEKKN